MADEDKLDFNDINEWLSANARDEAEDRTPTPREWADQAIENAREAIEAEASVCWWTEPARPAEANEALRPTGYRADTTGVSTSLDRNGYPQQSQSTGQAWDTRGLGVAGVLLAIALCIMTCAGMMLFDGAISFVR